MIKFKGQVLTVKDNIQGFAKKDKDGNKTNEIVNHRIIEIVMLVKDGTANKPLVVRGFDTPSSFAVPVVGETWETPEIMEYKSRFRAIPEASI